MTTSPLSAATLIAGLTIEQYDPASSSWTTATRTDFAIGTSDGDATDLRVMRNQGWVKAARYRITLLPSLTDGFGRLLILPSGESQGVAVTLDVPSDGVTAPELREILRPRLRQRRERHPGRRVPRRSGERVPRGLERSRHRSRIPPSAVDGSGECRVALT